MRAEESFFILSDCANIKDSIENRYNIATNKVYSFTLLLSLSYISLQAMCLL